MEVFAESLRQTKIKAGPRGLFSHQDRKKKSVKLVLLLGTLLLTLGGLLTVAPIVWMFLGSFKTPAEIYSVPQNYIPGDFNLSNYEEALRLVSFGKYFL